MSCAKLSEPAGASFGRRADMPGASCSAPNAAAMDAANRSIRRRAALGGTPAICGKRCESVRIGESEAS